MKKSFLIIALALLMIVVGIAQAATVQTHSASDHGFAVNSHLIQGKKDAILVDAQFTDAEAKEVVKKVKASKKNLTTIFITHGHPDHYFGLAVIQKAFPKAKILAVPKVVDEIKKTAQGKLDYWGGVPAYKGKLTKKLVYPESFEGESLKLEDETIELVDLAPGESEHATLLYIASLKAIVTGDMIYGGVHLWLQEGRPAQWLENIATVKKKYTIDTVLSGHGANGDVSLLDVNAEYITTFVDAVKQHTSKDKVKEVINAKYGKYRLPIILELSVDANVKAPQG